MVETRRAAEEWQCLSEGHGAGLPAVLQDSEGRCDCTASHHRSGQMRRVLLHSAKVTAVTCGCHLQWQGDHWLLTVSLTLEIQALSFSESVRFARD